jgi:hypothetical protein
VLDHVLLQPLPYPAAERLFEVQNGSHSGPLFEALQDVGSVETWTAATRDEAGLTGAGDPLRIVVSSVSRDFLRVIDARPLHG